MNYYLVGFWFKFRTESGHHGNENFQRLVMAENKADALTKANNWFHTNIRGNEQYEEVVLQDILVYSTIK